jgi:hypothetical protein
MFLTVSKSKDRDKIKKVYDLNAFKHFFKRNIFFVNLLVYSNMTLKFVNI